MRTLAKITTSLLLLCSLAFAQRDVFHAQNVAATGGGGGSNPTIVQHVIGNSGATGVGSYTVNVTSTASAESVIVAWVSRFDSSSSPTVATTGTSCTMTEIANSKKSTVEYIAAWVGTGCGAGVTGVTATGFSVYAMSVITLSNSVGVDVSTANDNGFGAGASWTSNATGAMASGNGVILSAAMQWRNVGGSESTTFGGSFSALDSTQPDATLGIMLATGKWAQPGTTTGQSCTGTLSRTNGSEQVYASCLVIK